MKIAQSFLWLQAILLSVLVSGCQRSQTDLWDDTRTCGRYMGQGFRSLGGKHGCSRQVCNSREFAPDEDYGYLPTEEQGNYVDGTFSMADVDYPQARELPGDPGSGIPGIQAFTDPSLQPALAAIFQNVHFDFDSPSVRGESNLNTLRSIANYLRTHPRVYLFIEGHCDQRGPEAHNLALGAQRANGVRNLLIEQGVDPDHLFTVSYGKERPLILESHEEAWRQNRRAEFKIYQR